MRDDRLHEGPDGMRLKAVSAAPFPFDVRIGLSNGSSRSRWIEVTGPDPIIQFPAD